MASENELCDTCKRCHESGLEANEHCEYYGEPNGCNHPKGWFVASENETVEDIVREMRDRNEVRKVRLRQYGGVHCNCAIAPDDVPAVYADRIESAWRREKAELQLAIDAEKARHTDDYKDERIRAQDEEIKTLKDEFAELRKCMKEVLDDYVCKGGAAFENGCEGCVDAIGCRLPMWRKSLEGANATIAEGGEK